jgi:Thiamine pyrophosphate enzyme, N-terminal TPP binding domain
MGDAEARQDATPDAPGLDWQRTIADTLVARGVTVAAYVPDTRLQGILRALAGHNVLMRSLTREEECVGYAAGQRIAGGRPVVLMQSSGLGNAINALGSLAVPYRLGVPLLVSMPTPARFRWVVPQRRCSVLWASRRSRCDPRRPSSRPRTAR